MKIFKLIKIVMIILSIVTLIYSLFIFDGTANSDVEIFLIYSMGILTFPFGLVSILLLSLLYNILTVAGFVVETGYLNIILIWLFCFLFGFIQWHFIFPKIAEYILKKPHKKL